MMIRTNLRPPTRKNQPGRLLWRMITLLMVGLALAWADFSRGGENLLSSQPSKMAIEGKKSAEQLAKEKRLEALRRKKKKKARARRRAQQYEVAALPLPPLSPMPSSGGSSKAKLTDEKKEEEDSGPWSGSIGAEHYGGFYEDVDPTSMLILSAAYKFKYGMTMSVGQAVTKLYRVIPGESEWQANDTSLGLSGVITKDWFAGIGVSGSLGATVPVSEASRRVDQLTRLSAAGKFSRSFIDKKIGLSLSPNVRYHVNRYTTTPTYEGSGGGRPLTRYSVGAAAGLALNFHEKLSLISSASVQQVFYEKVQFENSTRTLGVTNPPTHFYSWAASLNFQPLKNWSLSLGYSHGQKLENPWGVEVLVFDDRVSQWSLGTSLSF